MAPGERPDVAAALAAVARGLPGGGEDRPGQVRMARAVETAIGSGRHLVVQAGTGTGKSLAYLVPAVLSGRRVVVATATKALQDQLAGKDLPALAAALETHLSFAVLKGRSNYLCLQRAAETQGHGVQQELDTGTASHPEPVEAEVDADGGRAGGGSQPARLAAQVRRLLEWARTSETGDRGELDFEPSDRAWGALSVGPRECPGAQRCPEGEQCFAERARAEAAEADVVVVNTHLYGAHLASGGAVLPPHDVVVFDEAHEMEEVMTSSLGTDLSPGRLRALHAAARPLLGADDQPATDLGEVADRLRAALAGRVGQRVLRADTPSRRQGAGGGARERPFFGQPSAASATPTGGAADDADLRAVLELASNRAELLRTLLAEGGGGPAPGEGRDADAGRRTRALVAAGNLADDLGRFGELRDDDVAWVDGAPDAPVLRLSPVDVAPLLAGALWPAVTAVLTSATVPPRLEDRLGLAGAGVDRLDVGSPFDFRTHAVLYVARHLPDRRRPDAERALVEELAALIGAAGGRTLALFTSRRATEAAAAALEVRLPYRVLVQGSLPKRRLLELFSEDETSCLFATLGFWQGVDVPGRALSMVTLDRLPFGRPDDPLLEARRERAGDAAFALVDLPRAATLLAQGVGRLIRSASDHGVVAVLDPRLATASYRRVLLDALPPMRRTVDRAEVAAFLARVLEPGGTATGGSLSVAAAAPTLGPG